MTERDENKFTLRRVRIGPNGYAVGSGHYYGVGQPVFWSMNETGTWERTFRAADRGKAKELVRKERPDARFYC